MASRKGLTLFEVLVVVAILAFISALVVPNVITWRNNVKLMGAATNLKGDFELAKTRAIRENNHVAIIFETSGQRYRVFIDSGLGDGTPGNWIRDGTEPLLRDREMPSGVSIDIADTSFGRLGQKTRFTGRGHCTAGHTFLLNQKGEKIKMTLNGLGQITLAHQ